MITHDYDEIMERLADPSKIEEQLEAFVPFFGTTVEGKVRVEIEFPDPQAMIEWITLARNGHLLPEDAAPFGKDALDNNIEERNTFIMRRVGAKPDDFRLHVKRTDVEGA